MVHSIRETKLPLTVGALRSAANQLDIAAECLEEILEYGLAMQCKEAHRLTQAALRRAEKVREADKAVTRD